MPARRWLLLLTVTLAIAVAVLTGAVAAYAYDGTVVTDRFDAHDAGHHVPQQAVHHRLTEEQRLVGRYDHRSQLARTSARQDAEGLAPRAIDDLAGAANRASAAVGPGSGAVYGTRVHSAFAAELRALWRRDVFSEVSYLNGRVVPYGTRGSVRLDAVVGSPGAPTAIFDLKTGAATLSSSRIAQIRSHLPPGFQDIPVHELRPG